MRNQKLGLKGLLFLILVLLTYISTVSSKLHERHVHLRNEIIDTTERKSLHEVSFIEGLPKIFVNIFKILGVIDTQKISEEKIKAEEHESYLVHFDHQLKSHDPSLEELKKLGILVGDYIPRNTYMVSAKPSQIKEAKHVTGVLWIGDMHHENKQPDLKLKNGFINTHIEKTVSLFQKEIEREERLTGRKLQSVPTTPTRDAVEFVIMAHLAKHESKQQLEENIKSWTQELKVLTENKIHRVIAVSDKKIATLTYGAENAHKVSNFLAKKGLVHWVEIKPPTKTHNKYASMVVQSFDKPESKPMWNRGINGAGQIVGIGDTGLDTYHCFFYDDKNDVPYQRLKDDQSVVSKHRKINAFWNYMDKTDSLNGHGTHVCGIISGEPHSKLSPAPVKEYASLGHASKLNFMDCGCDTDAGCTCPADTQCECNIKEGLKCDKKFGVVYLPLDLNDGYFEWFYRKGAKIVSSSWGTGYYKDFNYGYSTSSQEIDEAAYAHKDLLPLFAAGNSGGVYGYASLTSESEAKNALVVGASMSMLQSFQANTNYTDYTHIIDHYRVELFQRYCSKGSLDFNAALCEEAKKFDQDMCCDDGGTCGANPTLKCCGVQKFKVVPGMGFRCCPQCISLEIQNAQEHYSPNNLAFFTARGPAVDGRIKPDIVTVGDFVLSSRARGTVAANKCEANQKMQDIMTKKEGTSMSSPVAGAAAALIRQYYVDGYYPTGEKVPGNGFNPSAALVKATIIHSAKLLDGYIFLLSKRLWWHLRYQNGQRFQLASPLMQGYGRIELNNVLAKDSGMIIYNTRDREVSSGDIHSYCVGVVDSKKPLKITLVWTDPPASVAARHHLVNDLDLIVITSTKNIYYGNGVKSRIGTAKGSPDYINNVEEFTYENPPQGKYTIVVRGNSVPKGPQPYAIVVSGGIVRSVGCEQYSGYVMTSDLNRYLTMSYAFGMLAVILIPALALVALYFFLQYRAVTTSSSGYKQSYMKDGNSAEPLINEDGDEGNTREYEEFQDQQETKIDEVVVE
eukprot:gene11694-4928_t